MHDIVVSGMAAEESRYLPNELIRPGTVQANDLGARVVDLYAAHRERIYRFLVGNGMTPGEAQEATQDVFIELLLTLRKGAHIASEHGWLYAVAGRAAVDYWRRGHGAGRMSVDISAAAAQNLVSPDPSPERQAEHLQSRRRLASALTYLPKEQRLCIQLRMQGLRYREIADILHVSTSTAAEWIAAAVERLRGAVQ